MIDEETLEKPQAPEQAPEAEPITSNKAFWTGIGIGSAGLVAALMYARRPKRKK